MFVCIYTYRFLSSVQSMDMGQHLKQQKLLVVNLFIKKQVILKLFYKVSHFIDYSLVI